MAREYEDPRALRRATPDEVPKEKLWSLDGVWEIEHNLIERYLHSAASDNVGHRAAQFQRPHERLQAALKDGEGLTNRIRNFFPVDVSQSGALMREAQVGDLRRYAPSSTNVGFLLALTWLTISIEVAIFLLMWVLGFGGNLLTVLVGILLAVFGYLSGEGLGRILTRRKNEQRVLPWIYLISGLVGIIGLTSIRALAARQAASEGEDISGLIAVVVTTFLLALAVAVFHAAHMERSERRKRLVDDMFMCQQWHSKQNIIRACDNDHWREVYEHEVQRIMAHDTVPRDVAEEKQADDNGSIHATS
jgi:cytochrome c biogenesis protein CcdA